MPADMPAVGSHCMKGSQSVTLDFLPKLKEILNYNSERIPRSLTSTSSVESLQG
jgi:hypothetical protein